MLLRSPYVQPLTHAPVLASTRMEDTSAPSPTPAPVETSRPRVARPPTSPSRPNTSRSARLCARRVRASEDRALARSASARSRPARPYRRRRRVLHRGARGLPGQVLGEQACAGVYPEHCQPGREGIAGVVGAWVWERGGVLYALSGSDMHGADVERVRSAAAAAQILRLRTPHAYAKPAGHDRGRLGPVRSLLVAPASLVRPTELSCTAWHARVHAMVVCPPATPRRRPGISGAARRLGILLGPSSPLGLI